jgi:hypothetical protein
VLGLLLPQELKKWLKILSKAEMASKTLCFKNLDDGQSTK